MLGPSLLLLLLLAQDQPPVFRTTTRLVQVNVVVHGKDGQPVADLKKEDFTVFEKGKPQEIVSFSVDSLSKPLTNPVKLPPHIFSNQLAQQSGVPTSVTVILLDSLNTKWADQTYARRAVIDFLLQVKPTDHIAIYQLGRRFKILHDYTTDASALVEKLQRFRGEAIPDVEQSNAGFDLGPVLGGASIAEATFFETQRILDTLKALEVVANHLSSVQGRKNLIWVSGGFPLTIGFNEIPSIGAGFGSNGARDQRIFTPEMDQTIRALNNAGVSVYPVDARGLMVDPRFSAANRTISTRPSPPVGVAERESMLELADRTGGRAYYNTNDLKNAVRQAIGDSEVTYTLGYHPVNGDMDGKFRDIKVKVDRSGLNVRYRKGYFAMKPTSETPQARAAEIQSAVWSPLDATALPLNARVDFVNTPQPNTVHVFVQADARNLSFEQKDDRHVGDIDIFIVQKDDRGNVVGDSTHETLDMHLKEETYQKIVKQGLIYERAFPRKPGATKLRVVVRDIPTGAIGSVTVPYKQVEP